MPQPETIAVRTPLPAALLAKIRAASGGARVVEAHQLKAEPQLWREAEVLFTHLVKPEVLREAEQLRWIQTMGAGVEWLLAPEVVARTGLTITNASGVHAEPITEHVFGLMLALARRLPEVLALQREQRWDRTQFEQNIPLLAGSSLAILGVGAIGKHLARVGAAFGMRVIGLRRGAEPVANVERMYAPEQLPELLAEAQYIVNALPLTAATRGLLGAREFAQMRSDALLINIGRGATIQTDALLAALRDKRIAGAGLDVTDPEPLPSEHPLWRLNNVIITPHFSGGRPGYIEEVTEIFVDNLARYRNGQTLRNVVNLQAGY